MNKNLPKKIVDEMYEKDWFSQWLGIERVEVETGRCVLKMTVRKEMLNGFAILHGGVTFSLADSALAFASNSHGRMSVSIEASMSYIEQVKEGDIITAIAEEQSLTNKIGIYNITVTKQDTTKVALFKGTVYRTSREWFSDEGNESTDTNNESKRIYEKGKLNKELTPILKVTDSREIEKENNLIYPDLSYKIIGSAFEVYNSIGGKHKELVYQKALFEIFRKNNIKIKQQVFNPVKVEGKTIGKNYFDFIVENQIVVEIKSNDRFSKSHFDQLLNYLIVSKIKLGILISFGVKEVKFKRVLNIDLLNKEKINSK